MVQKNAKKLFGVNTVVKIKTFEHFGCNKIIFILNFIIFNFEINLARENNDGF